MFPSKGLKRLGDVPARSTIEAVNRTGETLKKGMVVQLDLSQDATESTTIFVGGSADGLANVVACVQADIDDGGPVVVYAGDTDLVDNAKGVFVEYGIAEVAVLDDDETTTDLELARALGILVSESAYACQGKAAADHRGYGLSGAAAAASGSTLETPDTAADYSLVTCWWTGGVPLLGTTKDA